MSDLDVVIKALRAEADWCLCDSDRIEAEVGHRLKNVAERIEEAVKQRRLEAHDYAPVILGLDIPDVTEDTEDHCRLHCGCNGLNWGH